VVPLYRISGTKGRQKRPRLGALLKGLARRQFDSVADRTAHGHRCDHLPVGYIGASVSVGRTTH
jgi:hypothetical protein